MDAKLDISALQKAQEVFEAFRKHLNTDQEKAGAVQAFEFCYELSWKMMKRVLKVRGQETGSPKDTFRRAFEERLIEDPESWFGFQMLRNLTVHTYNEDHLERIVREFDRFSEELGKWMSTLKRLPECS